MEEGTHTCIIIAHIIPTREDIIHGKQNDIMLRISARYSHQPLQGLHCEPIKGGVTFAEMIDIDELMA